MTRSLPLVLFAALMVVMPVTASAQATSSNQDARPATTTFMGDTGLWFVPTAEILPARQWSASVQRTSDS